MGIELSKEEVNDIIPSLKRYFEEELDENISDFQAKLLIDYMVKEIGPFSYNKGVADAEQYFREKLEDLSGSCHEFGLTYWNKRKS